MFTWLQKHAADRRLAREQRLRVRQIYDAIVAQARHESFYRRMQVPDTVRGRFELLALHMYLVLDRLRAEDSEPCGDYAQQLVDTMFDDMDDVARELGIGDMGVAPRIKKLARSFRSRLEVYERAMGDAGDEPLAIAIGSILFDNDAERQAAARQLAAYLYRERERLKPRRCADLLAGPVPGLFGAPEEEIGDEPAR